MRKSFRYNKMSPLLLFRGISYGCQDYFAIFCYFPVEATLFSNSMLTIAPENEYYMLPYSTDEESEIQKGKVTCPESDHEKSTHSDMNRSLSNTRNTLNHLPHCTRKNPLFCWPYLSSVMQYYGMKYPYVARMLHKWTYMEVLHGGARPKSLEIPKSQVTFRRQELEPQRSFSFSSTTNY